MDLKQPRLGSAWRRGIGLCRPLIWGMNHEANASNNEERWQKQKHSGQSHQFIQRLGRWWRKGSRRLRSRKRSDVFVAEKMQIAGTMRAMRHLSVLMPMVIVHIIMWHLRQRTMDDTRKWVEQREQKDHHADE